MEYKGREKLRDEAYTHMKIRWLLDLGANQAGTIMQITQHQWTECRKTVNKNMSYYLEQLCEEVRLKGAQKVVNQARIIQEYYQQKLDRGEVLIRKKSQKKSKMKSRRFPQKEVTSEQGEELIENTQSKQQIKQEESTHSKTEQKLEMILSERPLIRTKISEYHEEESPKLPIESSSRVVRKQSPQTKYQQFIQRFSDVKFTETKTISKIIESLQQLRGQVEKVNNNEKKLDVD